jgi:hypothetical protein
MQTPAIKTNLPHGASLIHKAVPEAMQSSAAEPKIGQREGSGTK